MLFCVLFQSCGAHRVTTAPSTGDAETANIDGQAIAWQPWERASFERAEREERFLLISVQASWCHWCHVMNDETFGDPRVRQLISEHFVAIMVDSDGRPDLAERFRNYAWPATVILSPSAELLRPMRGYRPPGVFAAVLQAAIDGTLDVIPDEQETTSAEEEELYTTARQALDGLYDEGAAGWGRRQKYPYYAPIEHSLLRTDDVNEEAEVGGGQTWRNRALATADAMRTLIDPVFGGVYQYSLRGRWDRPHFEKIAAVQAMALSAFAISALSDSTQDWSGAMDHITRYLDAQLSSENGAFYTSQDADLSHEVDGTTYYALDEAERLALGFPRVDESIYVDLNARIISALVLAARAGNPELIERAVSAAEALELFFREDGGYDHGQSQSPIEDPTELRYLRDQAHMGQAALALFEATGDRKWLSRAEAVARFVMNNLRAERGYHAHTEDPAAVGTFANVRVPLRENAVMARVFTSLYRRTHDDAFEEAAAHALSGISIEAVQSAGRRNGQLLVTLERRRQPYVVVTIVGQDGEDAAEALRRAAFEDPTLVRLVQSETPETSRYPYPGEAAAYMCSLSSCSPPIYEPSELSERITAFVTE